jgi:hypothetical protein
MEIQTRSLVSRSHLLRMTALTQRTVDHTVKAYELNSLPLCRKARLAEPELRQIELSIGDRGRTLSAAGKLMNSTSRLACCSLRIYSALRITHTAATEIARNTRLKIAKGRVSTSAATVEMANFVNSLVRLNTVAFFNQEAHHAKTVLQLEGDRRKCDLWLYRGHDFMQRTGAEEEQELAIFRCFGQIAEQAYEIADALTQLLKSDQRLSADWQKSGNDIVGNAVVKKDAPDWAGTKWSASIIAMEANDVLFDSRGICQKVRSNPNRT